MRAITGQFYIVAARYGKLNEDGTKVKTTERYVVDAQSWGESEERVTRELYNASQAELEIPAMKKAKFAEIFMSEDGKDDKFYDCALSFDALDEKTGKEVHTKVHYLVQACSIDKAQKNVETAMKDTLSDYVIDGLVETKIFDIILG